MYKGKCTVICRICKAALHGGQCSGILVKAPKILLVGWDSPFVEGDVGTGGKGDAGYWGEGDVYFGGEAGASLKGGMGEVDACPRGEVDACPG